MALKITTPIGTDKGITSEAYVRISDYLVSKNGFANFRIELFQKEADKITPSITPVNNAAARNQQVGESLWIPMTKEVTTTKTVQRPVEVEDGVASDGSPMKKFVTQDVDETVTTNVPDLSPLEDGTIFSFAYAKLKEKLSAEFGAENIVDC